jgi:ADP-dependent NAD(P)H-hydrate dehydratase / NAD(P)H-hydrate epimerase
MIHRSLPDSTELPRALYTAAQVREFDRLAIAHFGLSGDTLMERAGQAAFAALRQSWPDARRLAVLVGTGNNGGDGFVVARLAAAAGCDVTVLQVGDRERLRGDAAVNAGRWQATGGSWLDFDGLPGDIDLVVDAMLGTGLERDVASPFAEAVDAVDRCGRPVVALDMPTGLNADTGCILGRAVRADLTVTFIALKRGMFTADGPDCCGRIVYAGLQVPARVFASTVLSARRIDWSKQAGCLAPRRRNSHKGHYGHVLVIGGNAGLGGAARLAAEAALRVGAGLVSLATRGRHVAAVLAARPEIMVHDADDPAVLDGLLSSADVVAIGPGLGRDDWSGKLCERALAGDRPLVVDADALAWVAGAGLRRDDWVLTPHPGEAGRMLACATEAVVADRFDALARLQARFGGHIVLKGTGSLVAGPGGVPPALCCEGNPGMASGGMGDVLTGVIAGLMAQGLDGREAAESGVCLHAAAGDSASAAGGERGLLATDLVDHLRGQVNGR